MLDFVFKWRPPHFLNAWTPFLWLPIFVYCVCRRDIWWMSHNIKTVCVYKVLWENPTWMIFANPNSWRREIKTVHNEHTIAMLFCSSIVKCFCLLRECVCVCAWIGIFWIWIICMGIYSFKLNVNCGCKQTLAHINCDIVCVCVYACMCVSL